MKTEKLIFDSYKEYKTAGLLILQKHLNNSELHFMNPKIKNTCCIELQGYDRAFTVFVNPDETFEVASDCDALEKDVNSIQDIINNILNFKD